MAEINWTYEAELWLKDIYEYIAQNNLQLAARIVEGIYEKAQLLRQFPEIGWKYEGIPDKDIRILLYGHYKIAYFINPDGNIDILGVFHSSLDIDRYL